MNYTPIQGTAHEVGSEAEVLSSVRKILTEVESADIHSSSSSIAAPFVKAITKETKEVRQARIAFPSLMSPEESEESLEFTDMGRLSRIVRAVKSRIFSAPVLITTTFLFVTMAWYYA
ncbi:MAG: hypothetical protein HRU30_21325 [Rhodobacteraceae bacterium]|nr:hypothetical protein [Paracoccaceae bacterium]